MTVAQILARTLREAGITRMFGLPGGEVLDFIHAAKAEGIEFLLTRHEPAASFMADVSGQIARWPGVCVATLGPGAVNLTLGVANAFLDRSPMIAITATMSASADRFATHQNLDVNAIYRPFTKWTVKLDGHDTADKVRRAIREAVTPRMGPVHIALPSDVARMEEQTVDEPGVTIQEPRIAKPISPDVTQIASLIAAAKRPVVVLGLDINPRDAKELGAVRAFVEKMTAPVFVTPKAKGTIPEDHPLFYGVCAGVAGDGVIVDFFEKADLLIGIGFEPVESDKLWHKTMKLVAIGPVSIAAGDYQPHAEVVGELSRTLAQLQTQSFAPPEWSQAELNTFRANLLSVLKPSTPPRGLSGYELTRRLRELMPRDTVMVTDVGSIKSITSQAWTTYEPLTFFESNGLSAMSYSLPGAMAARLHFPNRHVLCTIGDGGFGMTCAEIETCVRERLHFITVVYNDSSLSLIHVAQQKRNHASYGVDHGPVDCAAVAAGFGAWSRRVETMEQLDAAVREGLTLDRPVVIEAIVDPSEYRAQNSAWKARA